MIYEISEQNEISFFESADSDFRAFFQPKYPNGDLFDSVQEATEWAEAFLAYRSSETAPQPPAGKGLEPAPRVSSDEDGNPVVWNEETQNWDVVSEPTLQEEPSA